ncbi:hypothetical protein Glove_66g107 [Diversispora epigaea]|uniref:Uncharacterized protein n=1 Tax=Diversispora epigaea TaxID=1348612 RepID=A0A397JAQ0_9GLOM|nr:hypothetical protein Glove_66g107 [Diversispora epigaea]
MPTGNLGLLHCKEIAVPFLLHIIYFLNGRAIMAMALSKTSLKRVQIDEIMLYNNAFLASLPNHYLRNSETNEWKMMN